MGTSVEVGVGTTESGRTPDQDTIHTELSDTDTSADTDSPDTAPTTAPDDPCHALNRCDMKFTVAIVTPTPDLSTLTTADLGTYAPARPTLTNEPTALGLVGLPTNVLAIAPAQTIPAHLLGHDLTIRFTPTAYRYDYGDGTTTTTHTPGTTWTALGEPDYSPTPTSHTYTSPGTYTAAATVTYTADIDYGTGWHSVPGTITTTTNPHTIRVLQPHTALTYRTCSEDPTPDC